MQVDDSEMFLDTDAFVSIAVGSTVEVDVCHLSKRLVFGLHHESNTNNHFNCCELSTTSDCLYGTVVHVTLLTLVTGYEFFHTLPYAKLYS